MPTAGFRQHQRQPRYSKEEFAQRGDALYDSQIRLPTVGCAKGRLTPTPTQVEEADRGKIVAITSRRGYANDIKTGDFEVDASEIAACVGGAAPRGNRLEVSHPDAQIWMVRIGSRHVRRFGGRTKKST